MKRCRNCGRTMLKPERTVRQGYTESMVAKRLFVSEADNDALEQEAARQGRPQSWILRQALRLHLANLAKLVRDAA